MENNVLICKKSLKGINSDFFIIIKGHSYKIIDTLHNKSFIYIETENRKISYFYNTQANFANPNLKEYFYTTHELRKIKLQKLDKL